MPHAALPYSMNIQSADRKSSPRNDGRELVVFESIVALLSLLLIISGFTLYISQAFSKPDHTMPSGVIMMSSQTPSEVPFSLVEV